MFRAIQHRLRHLSHSFGDVKSRLFTPSPAAPSGHPVTLSTDYHSTDRRGSSFDMTPHDHIVPQCPDQPLPQPGLRLSQSDHHRPLARPNGHAASLMTIDPCLHSSDFRDSPDTPCHSMAREGGLWQTSPQPSCLQHLEAYAEPRRTSNLRQQAAHPQMQYGLAPQWAATHDLNHRRSPTPQPPVRLMYTAQPQTLQAATTYTL